ncbi:MAG: CoA-binding protein [Ilumatobacteraceae bacterium]
MSAWTAPTPMERLAMLRRARTVAIVGASPNPNRASYFVSAYLRAETSYRLFYINPVVDEIFGEATYPSLAALPETPDIVDVFRRQEELGTVTDEAIERGSSVLWFQLGLSSVEAAERAAQHGLCVVMDRCLKIEHARFAGGLHLAGFDSGVISSRRHPLLD